MDLIRQILKTIPLFRHCSAEEITRLASIGRVMTVRNGQYFDLKKLNSLNIVAQGLFEIEAMGKSDVVYLSPGSFFGDIPFAGNRHHGAVKAVVDSTLFIFETETIYKFFLASYKAFRGYIRILKRMSFEIIDYAGRHSNEETRVISVCSPYRNAGKSFFASLLGLSLKEHGKTILLDLTYTGDSLFNNFGKKVTSPLSHRQQDTPAAEMNLNERIEKVDDTLSLMNISFGSKVKVDPEIISAILFILSQEYRFIVMDISEDDANLRDSAFVLSDRIFALLRKQKDESLFFDIFDNGLRDGQRVYYVVNEHFAGRTQIFRGGYILNDFEFKKDEPLFSGLSDLFGRGALKDITGLVVRERTALVIETNFLDSVFFSGFLSALYLKESGFDILHTSAMSFVVLSLYLTSGGVDEFRKNLMELFSPDRLSRFADITFPDDFIFKNAAVIKYSSELAGDSRLEMFNNLPVASLSDTFTGEQKLFSTGYLKDIVSASLLLYPLFEPKKIGNGLYSSGYPDHGARVESLFRTDVSKTVHLSVLNRERLGLPGGRMLSLYKKYLDSPFKDSRIARTSEFADRNLVVEVSESELKVEKIFRITAETANKLLKESGI